MGVEVLGSEMAQAPIEAVADAENSFLHEKENGKLDKESGLNKLIKFGSQEEMPVKGKGNDAADASFPKDAVDEWPTPKQIHSFYFVKFRMYDDPKIKAKIDLADKEVQRRNQSRFRIQDELNAKKADRAELKNQLRTLKSENGQYTAILQEKRKEIEPLQQALGKLRNTNSVGRSGLCSSEEELDELIHSLEYRMQHESISLTEEKQLLREIKQLQGTRKEVIANAEARAKIQESLGQKEAIQDQVKLMGVDLDGVRKEQQAVWAKIVRLDEKVKVLDLEIKALEEERQAETEKRDKAYNSIKELRKQRDDGNTHFFQSRKLLTEAKELAAKKDIKALEEFSNVEGEKFILSWNNNNSFREEYEKRLLQSLDIRQLSRDGRIRNPDEKPLVIKEVLIPSEPQPVAKAAVKRPVEEAKSAPQKETLPVPKVQKEISKVESKTSSEHTDTIDKFYELEKLQKNPSPAEEVDEAKLKELKREEEIAKAKQAMERKKKLAEKAAGKAAVRAQKEAEKKLKEREKKIKKKAAATTAANDPEELAAIVTKVEEAEKVEQIDEVPVPVKEKAKIENRVRSRNQRRVGKDSHPKALLKRKKSTNHWMWAAPVAVLVLVFLALGYYYLL